MKVLGCTFPEAARKVSDVLGIVEADFKTNKPKKDPSIALNKTWSGSKPISVDAVTNYLWSRGIGVVPENIRICPACYEPDTKKEYIAMVARIQNLKGSPIGIHRTYLEGSKKANIEHPKKLMTATEELKGSAIRLFPTLETLGIAEGIETALSCTQLFSIPTWATISTALMESFEPPEQIRSIIIYGDNDYNYAGQKSAYKLANRLYNKGLKVQVQIPPEFGDFNDVLNKKT